VVEEVVGICLQAEGDADGYEQAVGCAGGVVGAGRAAAAEGDAAVSVLRTTSSGGR